MSRMMLLGGRALGVVLALATAGALLSACATTQQGAEPAAHHAAAVEPTVVATHAPAQAHSPAAPPVAVAAAKPVSPPVPQPSACAKNGHRRLVLLDVSQQHLWLCNSRAVAFDSAVTTGATGLPYDSTPTGSFQIQAKDRNNVLTLNTGQRYTVKYWIPFDAPLFGFHDASWQTMPFGSQEYRTKGSHGCVHLPLRTIRYLYRWADVGTAVRIKP